MAHFCIYSYAGMYPFGFTVTCLFDLQSYSMSGPVNTWIDNHMWVGKPSRYVTSLPRQLIVATHPWVDTISTSKSFFFTLFTTPG